MAVQTTYTIGSTGDLENALDAIDVNGTESAPNTTYTFNFQQGGVTLSQQLSAVNLASGDTLNIQGNHQTLSGNGQYNGLFVYSGTANISNLTIASAVAKGGAGGSGSGGSGGGGLGGGLFVASGGVATLPTSASPPTPRRVASVARTPVLAPAAAVAWRVVRGAPGVQAHQATLSAAAASGSARRAAPARALREAPASCVALRVAQTG